MLLGLLAFLRMEHLALHLILLKYENPYFFKVLKQKDSFRCWNIEMHHNDMTYLTYGPAHDLRPEAA